MEMETNQEKVSLLPKERVVVHRLGCTLESPRELTPSVSDILVGLLCSLGFRVCLFCFRF